ncbi:MAG: carbon-phosphorus lyase complex subunit PhnI [Treponema sp.]|jgi:alpha-D-ribose 1-methylphosphonate 5-triphosphate synthase subunit PhnI|nr:carbon-phosphorus lyase complex subunit PhnI [Treponema sp.]
MAYSAVKGGQEAVAESIRLLEKNRSTGQRDLDLESLEKGMALLIDRIMGEAGFYAPAYAALALKQSAGSPEEAVFLLRAYRSTLSRSYLSLPMDGADMRIRRRISAAFKDIPGGQFLGATFDYTHRLLNFDLQDETRNTLTDESVLYPEKTAAGERPAGKETAAREQTAPENQSGPIRTHRVSDELRREGLIGAGGDDGDFRDLDPLDITQEPLTFPAPRSSRLQTLARADTGYISGLAYAAIRGFGSGHPTVGELRAGTLEVTIPHPLAEGEKLFVGDIAVTEVESLFPEEDRETKKEEKDDPLKLLSSGQGDKADTSVNILSLGTGYGMVFGRNDTKAIAMSILDYSLNIADSGSAENHGGANTGGSNGNGGETSILENQEFVLLHGDCLEMNGFISHLKLPHYVTFQSKLDRVRYTQKKADHDRL